MNSLISVIIPVYNVENYLSKCVDSVLDQTYKNLEIILINDGSTDKSGEVCDALSVLHKNVKVIHQPNGGVSKARNTGMTRSTGTFVSFIDADDTINPRMFEVLHNELTMHRADIAVCGISYTTIATGINSDCLENTRAFSGVDAAMNMLYQYDISNSPCAKLYTKLALDGVTFPEGLNIAEDLHFNYHAFLKSGKVVVSTLKLYNYLQRAGSAMNSSFSVSRMHGLRIAENILKDSKKQSLELYHAAESRAFIEAIYIATDLVDNYNYKQERLECEGVIRSLRVDIIKNNQVKRMYRVYALIAFLSPFLLIKLLNVRKRTIRNKGIYEKSFS